VASAIPIALAANMVRIIVLVWLAAVYGPKTAMGFIHYGSGFVVFGVALVCLAWLARRLGAVR
jgi:exosortase/archaeosortase family protein